MNLAKRFYNEDPSIEQIKNAGIKVGLIGSLDKLDEELRKNILEVVEQTKNNTGTEIFLAISYGGRDEVVRACHKILSENIEINEKTISTHLDAGMIPDPDMIVRTSGNQRLSNFLLWQSSYSELFFTKTCWPEFSKEELQIMVEDFDRRTRKYGK